MSIDIATHLQALYHSGQISGYIHARLPEGSLKTGWIEQGLVSKVMKGNLRDKNNQESLVIPSDRFTRLTRDRNEQNELALFIIGPKGLGARKFVAMVFGARGQQSLITFQTHKMTLNEIIQFILQNAIREKVAKSFEEPNIDYVEQLRLDASQGVVNEMTVVTLPKKDERISDWMKEVLLSPSSENIEIHHGTSNIIPKFALLVTRWLTGLELFKGSSNVIASLIFIGPKSMDTCFWDQTQKIAAFTIFNTKQLYWLSRKYLEPLWIVPGESIEAQPHAREVIVETRSVSVSPVKQPLLERHEKSVSVSTAQTEKLVARLSERLDSLESQLKSSLQTDEVVETDRGTMDVLQSKLSENIDRIESLSKRLIELEKRLKKI